MRRKALSLILLAIVVSHLGAAWTLYSAALWLHKQNKELRLSDTTRWVEMTLSTNVFEESLVEEDEIEIDNQLFDIVSSYRDGDTIKLIAVADHAENKIRRTLSGLQNEKTGWSQLAKQAQSFAFSFFQPEKTLSVSLPDNVSCRAFFNNQKNNLLKGEPTILEQPPSA
jgi:hypothetical protein